jgi:small subunit ribosomal protein S17
MVEEEKQEQGAQEPDAQEPAAEEAQAQEPVAEEAQAEEPAAEETAGEAGETPAGASDEVAGEEARPGAPTASQPADSGREAEDVGAEVLHPKEARKQARSRASGASKPPRSPSERAGERAEHRRARSVARRRYRASRRSKGGESGQGTPPAERRPGKRKVRQGTVVSNKPDKTITVQIEIARRHPTYEKVVRNSATLLAHDERNEANEGDIVRVVEARPLSKRKRWRLVEILERAR